MAKRGKSGTQQKRVLIIPVLLVFCVLGAVVFSVSRKIEHEMSESAINNLSDNLDLISNTIETILSREAEFQKLIADEIAELEDPADFVRSYERNSTMVQISLISSGETVGISNTGDVFSAEELDFSGGMSVEGLPMSSSYVNSMGTWAYTIRCPVVRENEEIAALYIEYIYDSFNDALPDKFYNNEAKLYLMDAASERFVLKPKGIGERDAGHMHLDNFCYANKITEDAILATIASSIKEGKDVMFYHDIQNENSLIYLWSVNSGAAYLVGYVPIKGIQRESDTVKQNLFFLIVVTMSAFFACCLLYFIFERQSVRIRRERESERELYNQQLREALHAAQIASSSKTMFLSNMSHDIRTPMNAIMGFSTLLEKDADNPGKVREYTKKITASGQHLLGLINDVLDISKIESGKAVLTVGTFALSDMVSAVDTIIRPAAKAKKQSFDITVTGIEHEHLIGDETRINQILINLLSNAVKYTQEEGKIWLRIIGLQQRSSQYAHIRIEVEDNGYGMTPEYLETIFDAFTRAENSTTNKVQGTGLGMAITKNIVELMGGTIAVTSEVGAGSKFTVELELQAAQNPDETPIGKRAAEDLPYAENVSLEKLHFLVAEDNEINAEILAELLEIEGATCEIVENGSLAVELFEKKEPGSFDAVLMDVQMPVMNGYEASRAIRALQREDAGQIPIIAMTANAFAEDVKDAMNAGMNAHIAKPINVELLKRTISQYCI